PDDELASWQRVAAGSVLEHGIGDARGPVECDEDRMLVHVEDIVDRRKQSEAVADADLVARVPRPERTLEVGSDVHELAREEQPFLGVVPHRTTQEPADLQVPVAPGPPASAFAEDRPERGLVLVDSRGLGRAGGRRRAFVDHMKMVIGVAVGAPTPIAGAYPQYPEQVHLRLKLDSPQREGAGGVVCCRSSSPGLWLGGPG